MAETFAPAYEFNLWFGTHELGVSTFEYSESHAVVDVTTQKDRGATAVAIAEYTCTVRFDVPVKVADEANHPDSGDRVVVDFISGAKVREGTVVITSMSERLGGKGGKVRSYQGQFSGTVTNVTAGATS